MSDTSKGNTHNLEQVATEIRTWRRRMLRDEQGVDDVTLAGYVLGRLTEEERERIDDQMIDAPHMRDLVHQIKATLNSDWRIESRTYHRELRPAQTTRFQSETQTPAKTQESSNLRLVGSDSSTTRPSSLRFYVGVLAMAAAIALVATAWWMGQSPAGQGHQDGIALFRCELDESGNITRRVLLKDQQALQSGDHFQIEIERPGPDGFSLVHVGPTGLIQELHRRPAGAARERLVLPTEAEAFQMDETTGFECLLLARADTSDQLLAMADQVVDDVLAGTVVRGADQKLTAEHFRAVLQQLKDKAGVSHSLLFEHRP